MSDRVDADEEHVEGEDRGQLRVRVLAEDLAYDGLFLHAAAGGLVGHPRNGGGDVLATESAEDREVKTETERLRRAL